MLQRSPILRFALEVFEHALELFVDDTPRNRKLAVLNLAQAAELSVKAALVENNISIFTRDGRTINPHECLKELAAAWAVERVDMQSRLELLIDERNAIQHRYGHIDDVTLDYHLETAYETLKSVLRSEFDIDLDDWIRDSIDEHVWRRVRFVAVPEQPPSAPSEASLQNRSAALDLIDGFSRYETAIRDIACSAGDAKRRFSTLDLAIKILASLDDSHQPVIGQLPEVYRLRNRVVHGESDATDEEVSGALSELDSVLSALRLADSDLIKRALETSVVGIRGAKILSWDEIESRRLRREERYSPPAAEQAPNSDSDTESP